MIFDSHDIIAIESQIEIADYAMEISVSVVMMPNESRIIIYSPPSIRVSL